MKQCTSQSSLTDNTPGTCPLHLGQLQDAYDLPCGHAACEECLYIVATASTDHRKPNIQCPVCQEESAFDPERKELEEMQRRGLSRPQSRSSSVSSSLGSRINLCDTTLVRRSSTSMRRYQVKINDVLDISATVLSGVPNNPVVNSRVTIKLKLIDRDGKIVVPNNNSFVRGTILLPDGNLLEIDLVPPPLQCLGVDGPSHSFQKIIVPDQVGNYVVEAALHRNVKQQIITNIPVKPSGGKVCDMRGSSKFKNPHDIFVTGGQYVITDKDNHRVIVVDREGVVHMQFGFPPPKGLKKIGPFAVTGDPSAFYVTDNTNKCVLEFTRKTAKLRLWAKVGKCPTGIALTNQRIFVADAEENNIRVFDRHAQHVSTIGYFGALDGALNYPWFLKVNSMGKLVVADRNNCRVQVFDPSSKKSLLNIPLTLGGKKWHCRGLALDRYNNIYSTARRVDSWRGWSRETIMVFSPDGNYLGNFGELREFDYLRGIAIDDDCSTAMVVDGANHRIKGYRL